MVYGVWSMVYGVGFMVQGLGFRIQGFSIYPLAGLIVNIDAPGLCLVYRRTCPNDVNSEPGYDSGRASSSLLLFSLELSDTQVYAP